MAHILVSLLAGLVFGAGLIVSGMSNPAKVLGFLDLAGAWDPSLAGVMAGAIAVGLPAFGLAKRRAVSYLGLPMRLPTSKGIDRRLVGGSLLFGIGWGIAGFCPGPGLVALGMGEAKALVFVAAMAGGMGLFEVLSRWQSTPRDFDPDACGIGRASQSTVGATTPLNIQRHCRYTVHPYS